MIDGGLIVVGSMTKRMNKYLSFIKTGSLFILKMAVVITEILLHFSGLKSIWRKLKPIDLDNWPKDPFWRKRLWPEGWHGSKTGKIFKHLDRKVLPTFFLWLLGLYVAIFGIADQRYQNRINMIENRANIVFSQLGHSETRRQALERIPSIQRMKCPPKPDIWPPWSSVCSFISDDYYWDMRDNLKEAIVSWKDSLSNIKLNFVDLSKAYLSEANLSGAQLMGAVLSEANLIEANLYKANLYKADLSGAKLSKADLNGTILFGANLSGTSLGKVKYLTKQQLLSTKSLYGIRGLDEELRKQVEKEAPQLFIHPDSLDINNY